MATFVTFFSYTPEAWARLIGNPTDRSGPVGAMIADAGGRLETIYYMFGERDGFAIFTAPDSATAAVVALVVGSSGAFSSVSTHELISSADLVGVLRKADAARGSYTRPGD
jgi:uncharacterized protein with GYD domain